MNMDDVEFTYTRGLEDDEVRELLAEHHVGVLALAEDGCAYAVPVDYHYDGDALILRLSDDGGSEKIQYVESTTDPEFLVYGLSGPYESWSILLRGEMEELTTTDESDAGIDVATVNDWFGPVRVFEENVDAIEIRFYRFHVDSASGRATLD